jgi:cytochrome c2
VPKTTMAFRGVEEADERADLVAYLKAARRPDSPQP